MTTRHKLANDFVELLRGKVTKSDLSLVVVPATCGEEFSAITSAVDLANDYSIEIPESLVERAKKVLVVSPSDSAYLKISLAESKILSAA